MSEEYIISLAFRTAMISFIFNIAVALYGIFSRPSLIKKLLWLNNICRFDKHICNIYRF